MQHTITTSKGKWLLVEVPKESTDHMIGVHGDVLIYYYKHANEQENLTPKTKHEIIATTSTITEDQAAGMVSYNPEYDMYIAIYGSTCTRLYPNAKDALIGLLQANQIPTEKVYVIIKIKE